MTSVNSEFCWHCLLPGQRRYLSSAELEKEFPDIKAKEFIEKYILTMNKPAQKRTWLAGCDFKAFSLLHSNCSELWLMLLN